MRNELFKILEVVGDAKEYKKNGVSVAAFDPKSQYIRIEPSVGSADGSMDNALPENLILLKQAGDAAAKEYEEWLDIAVEKLIG